MKITNLFVVATTIGAVLANPLDLEKRGAPKCEWECEKYKPKCPSGKKAYFCDLLGIICIDLPDKFDWLGKKDKVYCCKDKYCKS